MPTVKSKYKNPDKYIERLKASLEIERDLKRQWRDDFYAEKGRPWFTYESDTTISVDLSKDSLDGARLAQEVLLRGRITGYKLQPSGRHDITFTVDSVRLKD